MTIISNQGTTSCFSSWPSFPLFMQNILHCIHLFHFLKYIYCYSLNSICLYYVFLNINKYTCFGVKCMYIHIQLYHADNINSKTPKFLISSLVLRILMLVLESPVCPSITISWMEYPMLIIWKEDNSWISVLSC